MGRHDWYRNTAWDAVIEAEYRKRLNRARAGNRPQYLRIQANYLRESHPQVALDLLEEYFALGDHFDLAQAHVDRAKALLALGDVSAAVASYEAALQRERAFPNVRTGADLELACLIANERLEARYGRALEVLDERADEPWFPVQQYQMHGARALIFAELGRSEEAAGAAAKAMRAAELTHSGFRYHPDLGLVRGTDDHFGRRVAELARHNTLA